jgi:hypothetical protein
MRDRIHHFSHLPEIECSLSADQVIHHIKKLQLCFNIRAWPPLNERHARYLFFGKRLGKRSADVIASGIQPTLPQQVYVSYGVCVALGNAEQTASKTFIHGNSSAILIQEGFLLLDPYMVLAEAESGGCQFGDGDVRS